MFVDVEQNSDEWFLLRMKKATSSKFGTIMANEGKAFGDPAKRYAQEIALEIVTGNKDERSGHTSKFMDDGHTYEPIARDLYEQQTFRTVTNGGFFYNGNYGDSPDGNVGKDGCIEIKCVIANTHWERLKKGSFDSSYKWQIHGHILIAEKQWCDFVSYCPEMPEDKQLYIFRVNRDEDIINRMKIRLSEFWQLVDENIKILES